MSTRQATPWAPPGLPPATARGARSARSALAGGAALVVVGAVFAVLRGVRPDDLGLVLSVTAVVAAGAAYLTLQLARAEVVVGPGWLSCRSFVRRRWVRTDQLRTVRTHRAGLEQVLTFRDADGRKVGVVLSDLELAPGIRRQLGRDVRSSLAAGGELDREAHALLLGR